MAGSTEKETFCLYITYVDGDGQFLRISGQLDHPLSIVVETLFVSARDALESGVGSISSDTILDDLICAAKYKDGTYYRAKLINSNHLYKGLVEAHFIDYGIRDIISLSAIRLLDYYDPKFLQIPGLARDYYLSRLMHPSGKWDESLLLRLRRLICFKEYEVTIEANTHSLPLISIKFNGTDLSTYLVAHRLGDELSILDQEIKILDMAKKPTKPSDNPQTNQATEPVSYSERVTWKRAFLTTPPSSMGLQHNNPPASLGIVSQQSPISRRLSINRISRTPVNLNVPLRRPNITSPFASTPPPSPNKPSSLKMVVPTYKSRLLQSEDIPKLQNLTAPFPVQMSTPPPPHAPKKPSSPKKSTTYKSRLLEVGSSHKVFVSFAEEGPELFAVQLVTDVKKLQDMMDDINRRPHKSLAEPPMIGTVCLGGMTEDKIICRAIVMNLSGSQCKLFFVDFGDIEMVSYYDIFDIPEEFVEPNVYAMRFCLSGVKNLERSPYLNETFKRLVDRKVLTLKVVTPEGPPLIQYGELHTENENVLDLLTAEMTAMFQFKWMEMMPLESRESVHVTYVESCLKFYVQLSKKIVDLNAVMDAVKLHCESSSPPGVLPVGAACCARFSENNKWYRAHIRSIKGNQITVAYVDYGYVQEVEVSDIRSITPDLLKLHAQAMKFALKGCENKIIEFNQTIQLKKMALEKTLMANVVGVLNDDTMLVSLVDETSDPPLDIFKRMMLSTYRSKTEVERTPIWKKALETENGELRLPEIKELRRPREIKEVNEEGFNRSKREENKESSDRADHPSERHDANQDRNNQRANRNNGNKISRLCSPQDRVVGSFGSEFEENSRSQDSKGRPGGKPPYKGNSKFTQVVPVAQHKELPNSVPLETPFEEPTIEIGTQHEVSITWITVPDSFYAQILSLQPKFQEMMHKIPEIYKGVKSYTGMVPVGASVLARYPADGVLYRATVVAVQPFSKFIVRYVDFGNKQLVDAKDIWQLDKQLMDLPKMAVHCSLLGVAPKDGEWKANPEIDLCFNAPRYQCVFQENIEEQWKVYLWNNGVNVADTLVEKQLAVMSEHQSSVTVKDEVIDLTILEGQQMICKITHVESYQKFWVQLDLEKATIVENALASYDTKKLKPLPANSLSVGMHCIMKSDDKIYRAILDNTINPERIEATLPDYGYSINTSSSNLMILPTELTVYYYQSLPCGLHNYTEDSKATMTIDEMKQRLIGNKFMIYINYVDGIRLMSTLYDIATGKKIQIFEPDEGSYDEVVPYCSRAVFNYNFGMAYISHAENLNEIYLQKSTDSDLLAQLIDDLFSFYEEGTPEELTTFEPETTCAAKSSDGNWYRATIVTEEETGIKVQFSDYGNSETVPKDNVKKLDKKFIETCSLALVASLGLVALQDDALPKLLEWTTDKEVQVTLAFDEDGWLASLHLDGIDLSMKLVNDNLATPKVTTTNEEPKDEQVTISEPISLPPGCTQVYISHIDTPGHFWLQMSDKIDKIEEIQAELQANADGYANIVNRELGVICAAKYLADDLWYRAEILDADSDITTVRFIDYGNTDVLDNEPGLIKVLPNNLKDTERYAVKSSVNAVPTGTGEWSEPASELFTELVGDLSAPVDALIVLVDDTTYVDIYVNGQNLTDKLVSEGYAAKSEEPECGDMPSCFASHINSPSEFWIQLETAAPELQTMESAMVDAENFPELTVKDEGVICAAKYPKDGAWYRAKVIVDGSEGTEVLFIDHGNTLITDDLRSISDELKLKPALSRRCALQKPREIKVWSRKSEIKFNELAAEGATIFKVKFIASGDISIVELYLEGKSVTEELIGLSITLESSPDHIEISKGDYVVLTEEKTQEHCIQIPKEAGDILITDEKTQEDNVEISKGEGDIFITEENAQDHVEVTKDEGDILTEEKKQEDNVGISKEERNVLFTEEKTQENHVEITKEQENIFISEEYPFDVILQPEQLETQSNYNDFCNEAYIDYNLITLESTPEDHVKMSKVECVVLTEEKTQEHCIQIPKEEGDILITDEKTQEITKEQKDILITEDPFDVIMQPKQLETQSNIYEAYIDKKYNLITVESTPGDHVNISKEKKTQEDYIQSPKEEGDILSTEEKTQEDNVELSKEEGDIFITEEKTQDHAEVTKEKGDILTEEKKQEDNVGISKEERDVLFTEEKTQENHVVITCNPDTGHTRGGDKSSTNLTMSPVEMYFPEKESIEIHICVYKTEDANHRDAKLDEIVVKCGPEIKVQKRNVVGDNKKEESIIVKETIKDESSQQDHIKMTEDLLTFDEVTEICREDDKLNSMQDFCDSDDSNSTVIENKSFKCVNDTNEEENSTVTSFHDDYFMSEALKNSMEAIETSEKDESNNSQTSEFDFTSMEIDLPHTIL